MIEIALIVVVAVMSSYVSILSVLRMQDRYYRSARNESKSWDEDIAQAMRRGDWWTLPGPYAAMTASGEVLEWPHLKDTRRLDCESTD
jgi:hypothetical protein